MDADILGAGVAFPLRVDRRGALSLVRAGDDIDEAITIILGTAPGERPMRPEFGCAIHDFVFDTLDAATIGAMETAIREALDRWEPRVELVDVQVAPDPLDHSVLYIEIKYAVRGSNDPRNLVFPFYVIPTEET